MCDLPDFDLDNQVTNQVNQVKAQGKKNKQKLIHPCQYIPRETLDTAAEKKKARAPVTQAEHFYSLIAMIWDEKSHFGTNNRVI